MSLLGDGEGEKCDVKVEEVIGEIDEDQLKAIRDSKDLYGVLGVTEKASAEDIQAAYKQRAFRIHPDKHSNSDHQYLYKEAFEVLGNAKRTLLDPTQRRAYDLARGTARSKGKWSFAVLKERRKTVGEDYKKIESEIYAEVQLERAKMYNDLHEAKKIMAFGGAMMEARRIVIENMKEKDWGKEEAIKFASEFLGKEVEEDLIDFWINTPDEEFEGITREELEAECDMVDEKGKFKGYDSFDKFGDMYRRGGDWKDGEKQVNAACSDGLKERILAVRRQKALEEAMAKKAEEEAKKKEEEAKKRERELIEAELNAAAGKRARVESSPSPSPSPSPTPKHRELTAEEKEHSRETARASGIGAALQALQRKNTPPPKPKKPAMVGLGLSYDSGSDDE